jgi:hypothetical protein
LEGGKSEFVLVGVELMRAILIHQRLGGSGNWQNIPKVRVNHRNGLREWGVKRKRTRELRIRNSSDRKGWGQGVGESNEVEVTQIRRYNAARSAHRPHKACWLSVRYERH